MKKYQSQLKSLIKMRQNEELLIKQKMAKIIKERKYYSDAINTLRSSLSSAHIPSDSKGLKASDLYVMSHSLENEIKLIDKYEKKIEELSLKLNQVIDDLMKAMKETKKLKKVEEKKYQNYLKELRKYLESRDYEAHMLFSQAKGEAS